MKTNLNLKAFQFWIASHFTPLLVIWSPWVNGFTLCCFFSFCSCPSLHLLSLRTCQFLFFIFPHSSQDNAWDYDPAAQVWGCRDSGGCSYYCHWGGSGKSPHFFGNASSDSTNPHIFLNLFSLASPHNHSKRGYFIQRTQVKMNTCIFLNVDTKTYAHTDVGSNCCLHDLYSYVGREHVA